MKWITRERPKIDRIACPWLIRRFIDQEAEFYFVPYAQIAEKAKELQAIPFDIPEAEFTHYEDQCTFDFFLKKYELKDPALHILAPIVRGADTDDHSIAGQSSGLWAISAGKENGIHYFSSDDPCNKDDLSVFSANKNKPELYD